MDLAQLAKPGARAISPPSPAVPVVLFTAAASAVLGLLALAGVRGDALAVAPITLALFGVLQTVRRWNTRRTLRGEADAWILRGYENRAASRYGWRIDELTGARERRLLGNSLRSVVTDLSQRRRSGVVPLNRAGLRPHCAQLVALADRLEAFERPVSPSGILAVQRLLTEPGSPLYRSTGFDERTVDPGPLFAAIRHHLEVRP